MLNAPNMAETNSSYSQPRQIKSSEQGKAVEYLDRLAKQRHAGIRFPWSSHASQGCRRVGPNYLSEHQSSIEV